MASSVSISADSEGRTLTELSRLIELRAKLLGEYTRDAVMATAINVTNSLKSDTGKARRAPKPRDFTVRELPYVAAFRGRPARRRPVVSGRLVADLHPVNLMFGQRGEGKVFEIKLANQNVPWEKTKHKGCYYVMCATMAVAVKYAKDRVRRILKKESGMAKYAIGIAQAKLSTRRGKLVSPSGAKQMRLAYESAVVQTGGGDGGSGRFFVQVDDNLRYSRKALKSGQDALQIALRKAANKTAGLLNHSAKARLSVKIPTPFPEVATRRK